MSTFRIASSFLIFLIALFNSVGMAWSGTEHRPKLTNTLSRPFVRTAQLLQEIGEQEYRTNQFINAARNGDVEKVRKFLAGGMDVNARNTAQDTALIEASRGGQKEVVQLLLSKSADVSAKNGAAETAVSIAIMNKHRHIVALLRSKLQDRDLLGPALKYRDLDLARGLIERWKTPIDGSWLYPAINSGSLEPVKLVLDKGADPNFENGGPLRTAAFHAPREVVELLLNRGAQVDLRAPDPDNVTALSQTCPQGRVDIAKLLLDRGANINVKVKKEEATPLMLAVDNSKTDLGYEMVKLFLSRRADVRVTDATGRTALHRACWNGRPEVVGLLVDRGADIEAKDKWDETPLIKAAATGQVLAAQILIRKGAKVNYRTAKGVTALGVAQKRGHSQVANLLRQHGAK